MMVWESVELGSFTKYHSEYIYISGCVGICPDVRKRNGIIETFAQLQLAVIFLLLAINQNEGAK